MFLVEYKKGIYINAELIDFVSFNEGERITFTIHSDIENDYPVSSDYEGSFVNNLQVLNGNHNIEQAWHKLKAENSEAE